MLFITRAVLLHPRRFFVRALSSKVGGASCSSGQSKADFLKTVEDIQQNNRDPAFAPTVKARGNGSSSSFVVGKNVYDESPASTFQTQETFRKERRGAPPRQKRFGEKRYKQKHLTKKKKALDLKGEQLFGINSVQMALKYNSSRSQFYGLYLQDKDSKTKASPKEEKRNARLMEIRAMAQQLGVPVNDASKMVLNEVVENRNHQGVLLDCSPLSIKPCYPRTLSEIVEKYENSDRQKKPLILVFDEVQDPFNVGSALRSALFFDCDYIVLCEKNSCPLNPSVGKSSAGTLEFWADSGRLLSMPRTSNTPKFLREGRQAGFRVFGTALEPDHNDKKYYTAIEDGAGDGNDAAEHLVELTGNGSTGLQEPTIVVFGNEGSGLRTNVKKECDFLMHIPGQNSDAIDSLNIGVSVGVLLSTLSVHRGGLQRVGLLCRKIDRTDGERESS